jgi:hypothetical protein
LDKKCSVHLTLLLDFCFVSEDMGGANQVEPNKSLVAKPQSDWNSRDGAGISNPDDEHKPGEFEHSESRFEVEPGKG